MINSFALKLGLVGLLASDGLFHTVQAQAQRAKLNIEVAPPTNSQTEIQGAGYIPKALQSSPSPTKEPTRNVFGRDDRIPMTSSSYPWSTIGRVESAFSGGMATCTGTLIARDLVITNAHCVISENGTAAVAVAFAPNLIHNYARTRANVVDVIVGTPSPHTDPTQDWAILKLNVPLGDVYGWMEWKSAPLTALKRHQKQFVLAGYSADFPRERGASTAGVHMGCSIRGFDSLVGLVTHDCDMTRGASGGAIFYRSNQGMATIVALNSAERRNPQGEHPTRFSPETANYAVLTQQWAKVAQVLRARSQN